MGSLSGGGGGGEDIVAQQEAAEAAKQANRRNAILNLNAIFGIEPPAGATATPQYQILPGGIGGQVKVVQSDPMAVYRTSAAKNKQALDRLYARVGSDVSKYHQNQLDEDLADTRREAKFELARRGHLGGSQEIDVGSDIREANDDAILKIGNLGRSAMTEARQNDQQARLNAIRDITADVDAGSAIQGALSQRALSADQATAYGKGQVLGDAFAELSYLYGRNRDARATEQARRAYAGFGPSTGTGGAGRSYYGSTS